MIHAFRIIKTRFAAAALSGEGARLYGGRWNSPGRGAAYTAQSLSLALLEVMVHLENWQALRSHWSVAELRFPETCLERLPPSTLPNGVRAASPAVTAGLGDAWLAAGTALALAVPSVVVPGEFNYLINPAHPDMARCKALAAAPLDPDVRLLR